MGRLNRKVRPWISDVKPLHFRPSASALADEKPLLVGLIDALGTNATARLLGADRAQVSRWIGRSATISAEMGRRIVDLHDVLSRILRVYNRDAAALWLTGAEPLLAGARPIDVLVLEGAAPVIRAIDGIAQGAFA